MFDKYASLLIMGWHTMLYHVSDQGGWIFFFRYAGKKQTNNELRSMIDDQEENWLIDSFGFSGVILKLAISGER